MKSTNVHIQPVQSKSEWKDFVKFPYRHYKKNPYWVPPLLADQKVLLNPEKHPFYEHARVQFFIAKKENKMAGRIAAIIDHNHNKVHQETTGLFGFF